MPKAVRGLALGNLAIALVLAISVLTWMAVDRLSRGSLEVLPSKVSADNGALARINTYSSIEDLRREATALAKMREHLQTMQQLQGALIDKLLRFWWTLLAVASALFFANAAALYWVHRRAGRAL